MNIHRLRIAVVFVAALAPGVALAQHEQTGAGPSPEMVQCGRVQPAVDKIITAAMTRVESARLSNNPAEMRAAVDQLEAALRDIRVQLAPCAAGEAAAGHTMPGMPPAPAGPAAAPMDHSKMPMGGKPTAKPGAASGTKPAAPIDHSRMPMGDKPAAKSGAAAAGKPAAPAAPMDHSTMPMSEVQPGRVMDPVNGLMVDPATAPKTTYQGQTYYFSSEQSQKEFLETPARFAKKPKG